MDAEARFEVLERAIESEAHREGRCDEVERLEPRIRWKAEPFLPAFKPGKEFFGGQFHAAPGEEFG